ncbi:MAG: hypothetical protein P4N41_18215 [Negativicutes bacterium]|nr:hypothetical protein [Negativicutes bacterium]
MDRTVDAKATDVLGKAGKNIGRISKDVEQTKASLNKEWANWEKANSTNWKPAKKYR